MSCHGSSIQRANVGPGSCSFGPAGPAEPLLAANSRVIVIVQLQPVQSSLAGGEPQFTGAVDFYFKAKICS